jgi:hypothetical protein
MGTMNDFKSLAIKSASIKASAVKCPATDNTSPQNHNEAIAIFTELAFKRLHIKIPTPNWMAVDVPYVVQETVCSVANSGVKA